MELPYLFCVWVSSSKRTTALESRWGRSSDKNLKSYCSFSIGVEVFLSWVELSICFKSFSREFTLTRQLSKFATSTAPRRDARVSRTNQSLQSCTVTCSSVSPGFRAASHQPNSVEVDWVLEKERLGQKASENDKFSANCASMSRALVQHLSPIERKQKKLYHCLKLLFSPSPLRRGRVPFKTIEGWEGRLNRDIEST